LLYFRTAHKLKNKCDTSSLEIFSSPDKNVYSTNAKFIKPNGGSKDRLNTSAEVMRSLPSLNKNFHKSKEPFDAYAQNLNQSDKASKVSYCNTNFQYLASERQSTANKTRVKLSKTIMPRNTTIHRLSSAKKKRVMIKSGRKSKTRK
jgi:hypothetical protein